MNRARHPGFFARFLHTRAIHRLFRRMAMLESLAGTSISREMPDVLGKTLTEAARAEPADVLRSLASHADGLTEPEARAALRRVARMRSNTRNPCRGGSTSGTATATRSTCC
jgi:sirohydrochlorin ferrochelatase